MKLGVPTRRCSDSDYAIIRHHSISLFPLLKLFQFLDLAMPILLYIPSRSGQSSARAQLGPNTNLQLHHIPPELNGFTGTALFAAEGRATDRAVPKSSVGSQYESE